jgi:hypothetical protein
VKAISKDINMNFGLEKFARICLKRGRIQSKMHVESTVETDNISAYLIDMHSAGKHKRRNHDTPAHRPRNHTLYGIPPIPFVFQVTQKDLRSSLMMAGYC